MAEKATGVAGQQRVERRAQLVGVGGLGGGLAEDDLAVVVLGAPDGIVLPKPDSAADVAAFLDRQNRLRRDGAAVQQTLEFGEFFFGEAPKADDVTMLALRWSPSRANTR